MSAVYWSRLSRIYYANTVADSAALGFDDSHILEELQKPPTVRLIPASRLLADEAIAVFREYSADPNRVRY
jgi:hypothetical protein